MSKHSENALDYALFLAQKCEAELVILNVFDSFERVASSKKKLEEIAERLKGDNKEQLARYADRARTSGVKNVRVERVEGDPAEMILKVSRQEKQDMLIIGSRGLSTLKEFLLGSVSHKISHHADCPVLIVR